jgi:hypothetical protein
MIKRYYKQLGTLVPVREDNIEELGTRRAQITNGAGRKRRTPPVKRVKK